MSYFDYEVMLDQKVWILHNLGEFNVYYQLPCLNIGFDNRKFNIQPYVDMSSLQPILIPMLHQNKYYVYK